MPERDGNISVSNVPVEGIHKNISQVVIITTEDKLKNILNKYTYTQQDSKSWIAPLGIFLTLVGTLTTSTPNDFLLPKEFWHQVYGGAAVAAFIWLLVSGRKAWRARKSMSVENIIERIKNNS